MRSLPCQKNLATESDRQYKVVVDSTVASEEEQNSIDSDVRYAVLTATIGGDMLASPGVH